VVQLLVVQMHDATETNGTRIVVKLFWPPRRLSTDLGSLAVLASFPQRIELRRARAIRGHSPA
jgi:hypothetical protein